MKKIYARSLMVAACTTMIIGCSKNEQSSVDAKNEISAAKQATGGYTVNFPANKWPMPGIEPKPTLIGPDYQENYPTSPVTPSTIISTPTPEYRKETCVFTFSHLKEGETYHQINNKNLNMAFLNGTVTRLKSGNGVYGWSAQWGYSPYVENENPEVLFVSGDDEGTHLVFSKPLIEFGFEVAPNKQGMDFGFGALVGNYYFDETIQGPGAWTHTPSGARLLAVKATKPFTMVTIGAPRSSSVGYLPDGFAITNIRYKLAK
jgi:hypothetical protein